MDRIQAKFIVLDLRSAIAAIIAMIFWVIQGGGRTRATST